MNLNVIYNQDCMQLLHRMVEEENQVDLVLTSPPYNNSRSYLTNRSTKNYDNRYDIYTDDKTEQEYIDWSIQLFNQFDKIVVPNGVVLYNISYGNESPDTLWLLIADLIRNTNFMVADVITWKKKSALPQNISPNKLTRICEYVFVFCRKNEYGTYFANKQVTSIRDTGQKMYEVVYNFISAPNNDGSCDLNKATYSTELCEKLLNIYAKKNSIVLDPFMGTGTTAVACKRLGHSYIGSELSENQCKYALERLGEVSVGSTVSYSTEALW